MYTRYVGLDLLRSIILIFGPTFHASMLMSGSFGFEGYIKQSQLVENILNYTNPFRMDLFFIISGFFASLLIIKKGSIYYKKSRFNKIIKPTIFSILTIAPITFFIIFFIQDFKNFSYAFSYRHLWFLVSLSIISMVTFLISENMLKYLSKNISDIINFSLFKFTLLSIFISVVFHILSYSVGYIIDYKLNEFLQISNSVRYFGLFIVGMIIFFIKLNFTKKTIFIYFLLFTSWYILKSSNLLFLPKILDVFLKDFFSMLMCLCIFFYFMNLKINSNKIIEEMSKIALPFYLIHLPLLILISSIYFKFFNYISDWWFVFTIIPLNILGTYYLSNIAIRSLFIKKWLGLK